MNDNIYTFCDHAFVFTTCTLNRKAMDGSQFFYFQPGVPSIIILPSLSASDAYEAATKP